MNELRQFFTDKRAELRRKVTGGAIWIPGHDQAPRNYAGNPYPFRQNSNLLYFTNIDRPGVDLLILPDGEEILYFPDEDPDDEIWSGPQAAPADEAAAAGVRKVCGPDDLAKTVAELRRKNVAIHYPPPFRSATIRRLAGLSGVPIDAVRPGASLELIRAVVAQRSVKNATEVADIEVAMRVAKDMFAAAVECLRPGITEAEVVGRMQGVVHANHAEMSFQPICTINGQVLHNEYYGNTLNEGGLLVIDAGAESPGLHYCSDITRTYPIGGRFTESQRDLYQVVLDAQTAVIGAARPGVPYRDMHLLAARTIARGLIDLGLLRGDPEEIVARGAHALFFPHGLGHMLGLDAHDMEDLGEDHVGYDGEFKRSAQFGLAYLRLARRLEPGFVCTVEPGVYFIPALIERWRKERKFAEHINYEAVARYLNFGGIRIEDDILITADACRVLGEPIPKTVAEIEELLAAE